MATADGDSYFRLVRQYPLKSIENDAEFDAAEAIVHSLLRRHLDAGEEQYLEALSDLVGVYEDKHHPIDDADPVDVLVLLMESHKLSQAQLAMKADVRKSTVSEILARKRGFSRDVTVRFSKAFSVDPAVFAPGARAENIPQLR